MNRLRGGAGVPKALVTASGGNHGVAVAYAGWVAGTPATVFVPANVSPGGARPRRARRHHLQSIRSPTLR
jgi:threonine dehydratase